MRNLLKEDIQAESYYLLTGEYTHKPSVTADPTIVWIRGSGIKFEGQGGAWYTNLAAESVQWNMKFHKSSNCNKDEKIYVTGISI